MSVLLSCSDEGGTGDRRQRKIERLRRKAMHSSLVQELREELWEMPEEIKVREGLNFFGGGEAVKCYLLISINSEKNFPSKFPILSHLCSV